MAALAPNRPAGHAVQLPAKMHQQGSELEFTGRCVPCHAQPRFPNTAPRSCARTTRTQRTGTTMPTCSSEAILPSSTGGADSRGGSRSARAEVSRGADPGAIRCSHGSRAAKDPIRTVHTHSGTTQAVLSGGARLRRGRCAARRRAREPRGAVLTRRCARGGAELSRCTRVRNRSSAGGPGGTRKAGVAGGAGGAPSQGIPAVRASKGRRGVRATKADNSGHRTNRRCRVAPVPQGGACRRTARTTLQGIAEPKSKAKARTCQLDTAEAPSLQQGS
jgi:hypothetical protein